VRLKITHTTRYHYDEPVPYALQRLRLAPQNGPTQNVVNWTLSVDGATEEVRFLDQFGNDTRLVSIGGAPHLIGAERSLCLRRQGARRDRLASP
jgi:transglutaminase-like putative cysteine protease